MSKARPEPRAPTVQPDRVRITVRADPVCCRTGYPTEEKPAQETISFDVDNAIQFERLSIPKRLDQIENELKANRIGDPDRLIPMLEKIEADQRLMNYARTQAGKIKKQIQTRK